MAETKLTNKERKQMSRDAQLEKITPMDPAVLADIDYERARIAKMIQEYMNNVRVLAESALKIDAHEASQLGVAIEVRDIVKSSNSIAQFMGIISYLNDNISDDITTIYHRRREFQLRQLRAWTQEDMIAKEAERKAQKAAYEQKRRDKAKEAEGPEQE